MSDRLYDQDVLAWSERQAALLRRLAAGEHINVSTDWDNVIDEVEAVGRSELHACTSLLSQALVHLLKQYAWPHSPSARHWRSEVVGFLTDAAQIVSLSMRQRIEIDVVYLRAMQQVHAEADESGEPLPLPAVCPFTLDDLLSADIVSLIAKLI